MKYLLTSPAVIDTTKKEIREAFKGKSDDFLCFSLVL